MPAKAGIQAVFWIPAFALASVGLDSLGGASAGYCSRRARWREAARPSIRRRSRHGRRQKEVETTPRVK
jgi:hypothetical protein